MAQNPLPLGMGSMSTTSLHNIEVAMNKTKKQSRVFELSWFDGRCLHCIQVNDKKRRRLLTTLESLPWVSQVRVVAVRR